MTQVLNPDKSCYVTRSIDVTFSPKSKGNICLVSYTYRKLCQTYLGLQDHLLCSHVSTRVPQKFGTSVKTRESVYSFRFFIVIRLVCNNLDTNTTYSSCLFSTCICILAMCTCVVLIIHNCCKSSRYYFDANKVRSFNYSTLIILNPKYLIWM